MKVTITCPDERLEEVYRAEERAGITQYPFGNWDRGNGYARAIRHIFMCYVIFEIYWLFGMDGITPLLGDIAVHLLGHTWFFEPPEVLDPWGFFNRHNWRNLAIVIFCWVYAIRIFNFKVWNMVKISLKMFAQALALVLPMAFVQEWWGDAARIALLALIGFGQIHYLIVNPINFPYGYIGGEKGMHFEFEGLREYDEAHEKSDPNAKAAEMSNDASQWAFHSHGGFYEKKN